jgi:hypothetical protein
MAKRIKFLSEHVKNPFNKDERTDEHKNHLPKMKDDKQPKVANLHMDSKGKQHTGKPRNVAEV